MKGMSWQALFLLAYRLLTEARPLGYYAWIPSLVLITPNTVIAAERTCLMLGEPAARIIDKNTVKDYTSKVRIYNIQASSAYNVNKYLPEIMNMIPTYPVIFITNDASALPEYVFKAHENGPQNSSKLVFMQYEDDDRIYFGYNILYDYLVNLVLRESWNPTMWQQEINKLGAKDIPQNISDILLPVMTLLNLLLKKLYTEEEAAEYIEKLKKNIISLTKDVNERIVYQLKNFLHSGAKGVTYSRSGTVNVTVDAMKALAEKKNWPSSFASRLETLGIISRGELSLQKTATIHGRSQRVYEIIPDKLFSYGEVRAIPESTDEDMPKKQLHVGWCGWQKIGITVDTDSSSPGSILILGHNSDTKLSVVQRIMNSAAEKDMCVIIPTFDDICDVSDASPGYIYKNSLAHIERETGEYKPSGFKDMIQPGKVVIIRITPPAPDDEENGGKDFFAELYAHTKKNDCCDTMLVLDYKRDIDLSPKSPLIKNIMFGMNKKLITCFLTVNIGREDYANPDTFYDSFSTVLHFGEFGFGSSMRRIFRIPSGNCPEKQAIIDMPQGSFIAIGSLASESGYIRDPVFISANKR